VPFLYPAPLVDEAFTLSAIPMRIARYHNQTGHPRNMEACGFIYQGLSLQAQVSLRETHTVLFCSSTIVLDKRFCQRREADHKTEIPLSQN
jgi:hypothetical protein